jgi:ParB family chromosome partitioning protein
MTKTNSKTAKTGDVLFIPLNKLKKSPNNARKTPHPQADIEALAASIEANGMLQSPVVEPEHGEDGRPTGCYLVTIGEGRRLAQLLRAKRKQIKKTEPVRCVLDTEHNAYEISLAENAIRSAMHPADQFEAFFKLHTEHGMSAEDVAARFGVTAAVVKQRLKLAVISPLLIKAYRDGEMNLDQLTAFAITDDHAKQERVWADLGSDLDRDEILQILNGDHAAANDRRAVFVGSEAYTAAGGAILRDLFDAEHEGFFTDPELLNRLAREKLQSVADGVAGEGWKWVEIMPQFDQSATADMRRAYASPPALMQEDQAKLDALEAEYEAFESDESDEAFQELDRLESAIAALQGDDVFDPSDIARAGVVISIGHDGTPRIERGFIRPEDAPKVSGEGAEKKGKPLDAGGLAPLSDKLVAELTSYRTLGLRDALAQNPATALMAVIHALAAKIFFDRSDDASCLQIGARNASLSTHASGIADSPAESVIAARHEVWAKRMPDEAEQLWDFIAALDDGARLNLLAHCVSLTVNAIRAPGHRAGSGVERHADTLMRALALDMTGYWQPTAASYFGRVSKERILQAISEGASKEAANNIVKLKKQAMAEAAEQRLAGKGWLPQLLRMPDTANAVEVPLAAE